MMQNRQYKIRKSEIIEHESLAATIARHLDKNTLRWYVAQVSEDEILVEATIYGADLNRHTATAADRFYPGKSVAVSIIPTGVACELGGYAGDAAPITSLLASTVDYLVTNPNAVNASDFIGLESNVIYTEGLSIDLFTQGAIDLRIPYSNNVGVIIEKADDRRLDYVFNVINAVRAVHGVNITEHLITEQPIGSRSVKNGSGAYVGTIDSPEVIMRSCEQLLRRGVNAIAITSDIQDLPMDDYAKHFAGQDPNPMGGVEAVISHLITNQFSVPAAHAPMLNLKQLDLQDRVVDARGAGEMVSASGLACVLIGLRRAPQFSSQYSGRTADIVNVHNIMAIVAPASCLGGAPIIHTQRYGIPIIAVRANKTILDVTTDKLPLRKVIEVHNYMEAAGALMALKKGISFQSIARPLETIRMKPTLVEEEFIQSLEETLITL